MTPYLFFFFISIAGLAYGTYTDFKERMISNWITYGMIVIGIAGYAIVSFIANDWMILGTGIAVTAITFAAAYGLYKMGVWAGGDVKLFAGLAALNPVNPAILSRLGMISLPAFAPIDIPIFPLTLFIFSLFAILPYGAILAGTKLLKNKKEKKKFKQDFKKRLIEIIELAALAIGFGSILPFFGITPWLVLSLLFVSMFIPKKSRAVVAGIALIAALVINTGTAAEEFAILFCFLLGTWFLLKLYSLSKILMRKPIKIEELEEGMISGQTIVQNRKTVEIVEEMGMKKLIKYFVSNRFGKAIEAMQPKGKEIISSRSAAGLEEKQISKLKELAKKGKIPDRLLVKESAPFVPAVLIAYIVLNIVGDVIWLWI